MGESQTKITIRDGFGSLGILIIIAGLLFVVGGGFFVYQYYGNVGDSRVGVLLGPKTDKFFEEVIDRLQDVPPGEPMREERIDTLTFIPSNIEEWKTYRNEKYGFEVRYPPSLEPLEGKTLFPKLFYRGISRSIRGPSLDICFASVVREEFYCDFELFVWDREAAEAYITPQKFFGLNRCIQERTYRPRFDTITGVEIDVFHF